MNIYKVLSGKAREKKKQFAVLIDPDKYTPASLKKVAQISVKSGVDYFFLGGSLLTNDNQSHFITWLKENTGIPVVLFPGNSMQINSRADAILLLSLISGRNPDMLIGKHVISAPFLKASKLEILPTGYMLIESGRMTTVAYMSNTTPIPRNKPEIAVCTAMAGEMLGLKLIYMDAGSGAESPIPPAVIEKVKDSVSVPLIIGGGITTAAKARDALKAGADLIVVGNALEKDPSLVSKIAESFK
jgi:putative glycerol-1-phosphate prenyltransferase